MKHIKLFKQFVNEALEVKDLKTFESFTVNRIMCDYCGWGWKIKDGGDDLYLCHKCGHDNNPFLAESKRPEWQDSDFPDAEGRFKDLSIKDLAAWLIKTRKKDLKAISGSLTQQIVFNRNKNPKYAEKMEKTRKEVYKQLDRKDLLDKMDESFVDVSNYYPGFDGVKITGYVKGDKAKLNYIEVKTTQRGSGIGSKAVVDFERWAKEQGAKYIEIDAYKKSVKFWEKMGYKLEKEFAVIYGYKQDYKTGIKEL